MPRIFLSRFLQVETRIKAIQFIIVVILVFFRLILKKSQVIYLMKNIMKFTTQSHKPFIYPTGKKILLKQT